MRSPVVLISIFRESLIGGVAVHSSNLYERLRENGLPVERIDFAFVFRRPLFLRRFWIVFKVGYRLLKLRLTGARIFHFHASNRALMFYLYAPLLKLLGARILLSLHSGVGYDKWLTRNPRYHTINKVMLRLLDQLIFMNPEESERIRKRYPFLAERIKTVNPFIAPPDAAVPPIDLAPAATFRMATIGVWEQRYNVEEAVRAAVKFQRELAVPVSLTVLQSTIREQPDYRKRIEAEIEAARATITVEVLEDRNDILSILARHDVFIRPSLLDSYGLCVAESLLVGTPAIATNVCRRCSTALLYPQGDMEVLHQHLQRVWDQREEPRQRLLAATEDSFYGYLQVYNSFGLSTDNQLQEV